MKKTTRSLVSGCFTPSYQEIKKSNKNFLKLYNDALHHLHYDAADLKLKAETISFAKKKVIAGYESMEVLEPYYFAIVGKPCYISNRGGEVPQEWDSFVSQEISRLVVKAKEQEKLKKEEKETKKPKNASKVIEQSPELTAALTDLYILETQVWKTSKIDKAKVTEILKKHKLKPAELQEVIKEYEVQTTSIEVDLSEKDEQTTEAYSGISKKQLTKRIEFYTLVCEMAENVMNEIKPTRTKRKRKVDPAKVVSKLKYLQSYSTNGITLQSVDPTTILGASELYVFNVKTRKVGRYIAADVRGLQVKGSTILNFLEKESIEKTVRRPEKQLSGITSIPKKKMQSFLSDIKAVDTKLKGRINTHCVLLRIL